MLDSSLRPLKDRVLAPLVRTPLGRIHPTVISAFGLVSTLMAAVAASQRLALAGVALWLVGRLADGVDGLAARSTDRSSDAGGLLDFTFDTVGYAAIPIGVAFGVDTRAAWVATAVLLASFYLNAVTLGYVAALLEKRGVTDRTTSAVLPRGLVEGTETIAFFTVAIAFLDASPWIWSVMAAAVTIGAIERLRWAIRELT